MPETTSKGSGRQYSPSGAQAAGMVSVQARCTINHSMLSMRERAMATRHTLEEVAEAVVDRLINFN
jgi:AmiR/NasT family two-component response regulator